MAKSFILGHFELRSFHPVFQQEENDGGSPSEWHFPVCSTGTTTNTGTLKTEECSSCPMATFSLWLPAEHHVVPCMQSAPLGGCPAQLLPIRDLIHECIPVGADVADDDGANRDPCGMQQLSLVGEQMPPASVRHASACSSVVQEQQ
eukprot:gene19013-biopygen2469